MKRIVGMTVMIIICVTAFSMPAQADRKIFGFVYPYMTLPKGGLELEYYLDMGLNGWDDKSTPTDENKWTEVDWRHQIEFEFGITDHLDFGFYNVFQQKPYGNFEYEGVKLRTRYRFSEKGALPIDPALYFEVAYFGDEMKFEEMLILAKDIGKIETALNLKFEQELTLDSGKIEHEFIPTVGVGYNFNKHVTLGLEYYGKLKFEKGDIKYFINYLGPTLSITLGRFYWTLAFQPQLGGKDGFAAFRARSLFGIWIM